MQNEIVNINNVEVAIKALNGQSVVTSMIRLTDKIDEEGCFRRKLCLTAVCKYSEVTYNRVVHFCEMADKHRLLYIEMKRHNSINDNESWESGSPLLYTHFIHIIILTIHKKCVYYN